MIIIFFILPGIFARDIGVFISPFWESKFSSGVSEPKNARTPVISLFNLKKDNIGTATLISAEILITSGSITSSYEKLPNFGGLFLYVNGMERIHVKHVETHPDFNASRQYEFDIGFLKTKEPVRNLNKVPITVDLRVHINDDLTVRGFSKYRTHSLLHVTCAPNLFYSKVNPEDVRRDQEFYFVVENRKKDIIYKYDIGNPVFKGNEFVGIISKHVSKYLDSGEIYACTWLGNPSIQSFIVKALENTLEETCETEYLKRSHKKIRYTEENRDEKNMNDYLKPGITTK